MTAFFESEQLQSETNSELERLKNLSQNQKNHHLVTQIESDLNAKVDPELWSRILSNLVVNAIKFSPEGGKVLVSLKKKGNKQIQLEVKDVGAGFPSKEAKKIFQRFYRIGEENRRTNSGSGLGLYFVKLSENVFANPLKEGEAISKLRNIKEIASLAKTNGGLRILGQPGRREPTHNS